jgi:hypothetical protein
MGLISWTLQSGSEQLVLGESGNFLNSLLTPPAAKVLFWTLLRKKSRV